MMRYLSQTININGRIIQGPLQGINTISDVINKILPNLILIAGIILFIILILGGFGFISSAGNPEKLKTARARITTGLIGFVLLIVSYLFVKLISIIFGLGQGIF